MRTLTISITLLSETLIGSGEGYGAIIDSDIVFDSIGIPYIPAKRIKGCMRDSSNEVCEMLKKAQINTFPDLTEVSRKSKEIPYESKSEFKAVIDIFGRAGQEMSSPVYFSNLVIEEYDNNKDWLKYLSEEYKEIISKDAILSAFTAIRQQTAIDEKLEIAKEHSLRTIRVLKKGISFTGEIQLDDNIDPKLLALACLNLRHVGTKRNRGFGEIECKLFEGASELTVLTELEALCKS